MFEIKMLIALWSFAMVGLGFFLGRFFGMVSEPPRLISPEERRRQLDALLARVR